MIYIDIALAGIQTLLIWMKLTEQITSSWWAALIPSFVWLVLNIIVSAAGKEDKDE